MNIREYTSEVLKLNKSQKPLNEETVLRGMNSQVLYSITGMNIKIAKIFEAYSKETLPWVEIAEEIGEFLWYASLTIDKYDWYYDIEMLDKEIFVGDYKYFPHRLYTLSNDMLNISKLIIFDGKELELELFKESFLECYKQIIFLINGIKKEIDSATTENIRITNIARQKNKDLIKTDKEEVINKELEKEII